MTNAWYLKLGSGKSQLIGTSRDRYHVGWIKLSGFSPTMAGRDPATAGGAGKATVSEFVLTKSEDRNSMELYLAANDGRTFGTADLEAADQRSGIPKLRMSFDDVMLGRFSVHANAGVGDPGRSETFTLSFATMKLNYNPIPDETAADMLETVFKRLGLAAA